MAVYERFAVKQLPPRVKAWIKREFPGYRKREISLTKCVSMTPFGWWWDGGSRNVYYVGPTLGTMHRWSGPPYPQTQADAIPICGTCVVDCGTFCGKPATLHLYISPAEFDTLWASEEPA